jgi:hypothetical protein
MSAQGRLGAGKRRSCCGKAVSAAVHRAGLERGIGPLKFVARRFSATQQEFLHNMRASVGCIRPSETRPQPED